MQQVWGQAVFFPLVALGLFIALSTGIIYLKSLVCLGMWPSAALSLLGSIQAEGDEESVLLSNLCRSQVWTTRPKPSLVDQGSYNNSKLRCKSVPVRFYICLQPLATSQPLQISPFVDIKQKRMKTRHFRSIEWRFLSYSDTNLRGCLMQGKNMMYFRVKQNKYLTLTYFQCDLGQFT